MNIKSLGLLNQGEVVEYTGDFLFDSVESVTAFRNENLGSSVLMDDAGAIYLMIINEYHLKAEAMTEGLDKH